jgi:hypothetical protein
MKKLLSSTGRVKKWLPDADPEPIASVTQLLQVSLASTSRGKFKSRSIKPVKIITNGGEPYPGLLDKLGNNRAKTTEELSVENQQILNDTLAKYMVFSPDYTSPTPTAKIENIPKQTPYSFPRFKLMPTGSRPFSSHSPKNPSQKIIVTSLLPQRLWQGFTNSPFPDPPLTPLNPPTPPHNPSQNNPKTCEIFDFIEEVYLPTGEKYTGNLKNGQKHGHGE